MRSFIIISLLCCCFHPCIAQKPFIVKGTVSSVKDTTPLPAAAVTLYHIKETGVKQVIKYGFTDVRGVYRLQVMLEPGQQYVIAASFLDFDREEHVFFAPPGDSIIHLDFFLLPSNNKLQEIIIRPDASISIKKDTVEYRADSFRTAQTRSVEDLIRNIEGFKVDPDGRITYRGKEVKTLLLDGDDLTQDQYQLISRNLNAETVDRLQVIDNYNKNRILGGLLESNQAAVNLKLKNELQGKLSGSISVAGGPEGRYEGAGTLLWLKQRFKMVTLANVNNIAKDATGLLRYQQFGAPGTIRRQEELTRKLMNGTGLVNTGSVQAPDIAREYVLDNRNRFVSPLLHFSLSKTIKMAVRSYAVADRLFFNGASSVTSIVNPAEEWLLNGRLHAENSRSNYASAVDLSHDNMKKFAGNLNLQLGWVKDGHSFSNITSGFFADTMLQQLNAERKGMAAVYNGAVKLNENAVLKIDADFTWLPEYNDYIIHTDRLRFYYNLNDSFNRFQQTTDPSLSNFRQQVSWLHKKGNYTLQVGGETQWQQLKSGNHVVSKTLVLEASSVHRQLLLNKLFLSTVKRLNAKSSLRFDINAGSGISTSAAASRNEHFLLWHTALSYKYKIKAFSGMNVNLSATRELPDLLKLHPRGLISGNAAVFNGVERIQATEALNGSVSFSNFKIATKFSLVASVYAKYAITDWVNNQQLAPQFTVATWDIVRNNRQAGFSFDIGSFVFPLNSTLRFSANANLSQNSQLVNNIPVTNRLKFAAFTATWIPNFKWPVLCEVNVNKNFFNVRQSAENFVLRNSNETESVLFKMRSNLKGNYYLGAQYNYLRLAPGSQFHLLSLFQNYRISKNVNLDFTVHNLLNKRNYVQVMNSTNTSAFYTFQGVGRYFLLRVNVSM